MIPPGDDGYNMDIFLITFHTLASNASSLHSTLRRAVFSCSLVSFVICVTHKLWGGKTEQIRRWWVSQEDCLEWKMGFLDCRIHGDEMQTWVCQ